MTEAKYGGAAAVATETKALGEDFAADMIKTALSATENENSPSLLFVCTGNTCRSPMAEAYFKSKGYKSAFSRGIFTDGSPISKNAVEALKSHGIMSSAENDYENHISKTVTEADIARADFVFAMTGEHMRALLFAFPQSADKLFLMPREISDPFGGDIDAYNKTLDEIIAASEEIFPKIGGAGGTALG
ncbi:MAG: hypothetical protein LUE25_01610 [Clostridiales bacterium]|nr:hypothetical protein [Clostridiales bacterium]